VDLQHCLVDGVDQCEVDGQVPSWRVAAVAVDRLAGVDPAQHRPLRIGFHMVERVDRDDECAEVGAQGVSHGHRSLVDGSRNRWQ
jgi:hypothetical protein